MLQAAESPALRQTAAGCKQAPRAPIQLAEGRWLRQSSRQAVPLIQLAECRQLHQSCRRAMPLTQLAECRQLH